MRRFALSLLFLSACSPQATPPAAEQTPVQAKESFPAIKDIKTLRIRLTRSACYGVCPWYGVEISGDGAVTYCGARFVKEFGERTRTIPEADVLRVVDKFRAADFFNLKDEYIHGVTDNPTYLVQISYDGNSKLLVDYVGREAGMPVAVSDIETAIDEAAKVGEWVGENMDPPPQPAETPACIENFPVPRPG